MHHHGRRKKNPNHIIADVMQFKEFNEDFIKGGCKKVKCFQGWDGILKNTWCKNMPLINGISREQLKKVSRVISITSQQT